MGSWVISSNPQYYDAKGAFGENGEVDWITLNKFENGDTVYIYEVAAPKGRGGIVYKTEVIKTNIPYSQKLDDRKYWAGGDYSKQISENSVFTRLKLLDAPTIGVIKISDLKGKGFVPPQGKGHILDNNPPVLDYIESYFI